MAISDEDKTEFFGLLDEWDKKKESDRAEKEAKDKAGKEGGKSDDDNSGKSKPSFAQRLLGGSAAADK